MHRPDSLCLYILVDPRDLIHEFIFQEEHTCTDSRDTSKYSFIRIKSISFLQSNKGDIVIINQRRANQ